MTESTTGCAAWYDTLLSEHAKEAGNTINGRMVVQHWRSSTGLSLLQYLVSLLSNSNLEAVSALVEWLLSGNLHRIEMEEWKSITRALLMLKVNKESTTGPLQSLVTKFHSGFVGEDATTALMESLRVCNPYHSDSYVLNTVAVILSTFQPALLTSLIKDLVLSKRSDHDLWIGHVIQMIDLLRESDTYDSRIQYVASTLLSQKELDSDEWHLFLVHYYAFCHDTEQLDRWYREVCNTQTEKHQLLPVPAAPSYLGQRILTVLGRRWLTEQSHRYTRQISRCSDRASVHWVNARQTFVCLLLRFGYTLTSIEAEGKVRLHRVKERRLLHGLETWSQGQTPFLTVHSRWFDPDVYAARYKVIKLMKRRWQGYTPVQHAVMGSRALGYSLQPMLLLLAVLGVYPDPNHSSNEPASDTFSLACMFASVQPFDADVSSQLNLALADELEVVHDILVTCFNSKLQSTCQAASVLALAIRNWLPDIEERPLLPYLLQYFPTDQTTLCHALQCFVSSCHDLSGDGSVLLPRLSVTVNTELSQQIHLEALDLLLTNGTRHQRDARCPRDIFTLLQKCELCQGAMQAGKVLLLESHASSVAGAQASMAPTAYSVSKEVAAQQLKENLAAWMGKPVQSVKELLGFRQGVKSEKWRSILNMVDPALGTVQNEPLLGFPSAFRLWWEHCKQQNRCYNKCELLSQGHCECIRPSLK